MIVTQRQHDLDNSSRFERLMQQGYAAQDAHNSRRAHRFWREAAMLNPTSEAVWQALLSVLEDEHDRPDADDARLRSNRRRRHAGRQRQCRRIRQDGDDRPTHWLNPLRAQSRTLGRKQKAPHPLSDAGPFWC